MIREVCKLPVEIGPCRARKPRFYFDNQKNSCIKFFYGGCEGNDNNFLTKEECEKACGTSYALIIRYYKLSDYEDVCALPVNLGTCRAKVPRFYFNLRRKRCEIFYYGGCGGNLNNFKTLEECEEICSFDG
ncbi:thrombin inhibitor hemalin-like [Condylostylus longicornis]|uniref:thrombin inhibitor hemalin-like n=1 Tax=Condylostylus longicornis TaxID=2530218 RepID=UPI00244E3A59|nr:thrombin inhibitor hemalin-like [Condylostylus longicornis]